MISVRQSLYSFSSNIDGEQLSLFGNIWPFAEKIRNVWCFFFLKLADTYFPKYKSLKNSLKCVHLFSNIITIILQCLLPYTFQWDANTFNKGKGSEGLERKGYTSEIYSLNHNKQWY